MKLKLQSFDKIKALQSLTGKSDSYNTPERIDVPEGVILLVPKYGTSRGDVFCTIVAGECILHCRSLETDHLNIEKTKVLSIGDKVGLHDGHSTRFPEDLGEINNDYWEIIKGE
jgi:hypothetical protein